MEEAKPGGEADLTVGETAETTAAPAAQAAAVPAATRRASTRKSASKKAAVSKKTTAARKTSAVSKRGSVSKRTASRAPRSAGGERARDVAAELLKKAGGEMEVGVLAMKVVQSGRTRLGGKTPSATVAAQIYTAAKNGVLFKKTSRGKVALLNAKAKA